MMFLLMTVKLIVFLIMQLLCWFVSVDLCQVVNINNFLKIDKMIVLVNSAFLTKFYLAL